MGPFTQPILDPMALKVLRQNVLLPVQGLVAGTSASIAANYGTFFVADRAYYVLSISENHRTAGSDGSPVTLNIEKCTSGQAEDSGVPLLATAFNLKATAATPQFGTLTNTKEDLILRKGDRLVMDDSGTLTAVADVCVSTLLRAI